MIDNTGTVVWRCFVEKALLTFHMNFFHKNLTVVFQRKTTVLESFLNNVATLLKCNSSACVSLRILRDF